MPPLHDASRQGRQIAHTCAHDARAARALLSSDTDRLRDAMLSAWDTQRHTVRGHAQTVHDGTGRFGQRAAAVTHARQELTSWAEAWRPTVPDLPADSGRLADQLLWFENRPELYDTLDRVARRHAEHAHPDAVAALTTAESAAQTASTASRAYRNRLTYHDQTLSHYGNFAHTEDPSGQLHQLERDIAATVADFATAQERIAQLAGEPAITAQPVDRFTHERDSWQLRREARYDAINAAAHRKSDRGEDVRQRMREAEHTLHHTSGHEHGPSMSR